MAKIKMPNQHKQHRQTTNDQHRRMWSGQLGDGTVGDYELGTDGRITPEYVLGLTSGVREAVSGFGHTCALPESNGVKCWGHNGYGQLGDGTGDWETSRASPVNVVGLSVDVLELAAGIGHTCALTSLGGVENHIDYRPI
jgi:alpha-tubulin suppressor-like RCC1 family protein